MWMASVRICGWKPFSSSVNTRMRVGKKPFTSMNRSAQKRLNHV